jgi:predicted nucleic acid-binding protein
VLRRKPRFKVNPNQARRLVQRFVHFARAPTDLGLVFEGWQMENAYGVQYFDALLLASANAAGCAYFLSEDLNDGQRYGSVQAINPFRHAPEDVLGRASRN